MRYVSTRGQAPASGFAEVLLAGLAPDGGLYLPESWPVFSPAELRAMRALAYPELAARVIAPFAAGSFTEAELAALLREAYAGFAHPAVCPLVQLETGLFVAELFHGPTLAFKDMAMQLLGPLFAAALARRGEHITIVGATSGDTGSAAIEACRDRPGIHLVMLHPKGRTSEVQRRQMTTVLAPNIVNLAVAGSFDDCQDLVKAMFADAPFRAEMALSAVNSINFARIAAQIPYYVATALALGAPDREVAFAVPTGNFGNVFAAWAAGRMGLPIVRLAVGSNRNDILTRFLAGKDMSVRAVEPSLSPSMDIQVSSNFERLLFESLGRDGDTTAAMMRDFRRSGRMTVPDAAWCDITRLFAGLALDDRATTAEIRALHAASGYVADPHSAIGIAAGRAHALPGVPMIAMGTAHPAKFPAAMREALGFVPPLPPRLASLYDKEERCRDVPADLAAVEAVVRSTAPATHAA